MTQPPLRIALAQFDVRVGEPEANLATARRMVAEAARQGAKLVLLPELWGSGYDLPHAARYATPTDAGLFAEMTALAREHDLYLAGSLLEAADGRFYNTLLLTGPEGPLATYRKVHLFRLMEEDHYLAPGESPVVASTPWGATGLAICYDLRFPELFRGYAVQGARLILLPAQWPARRVEHWRTLVRARAIEDQCFVAACNRVGRDPGSDAFGGRSALVSPRGEVLVEGSEDDEALLIAEADLAEVERVREHIPVLQDRRPQIYHR